MIDSHGPAAACPPARRGPPHYYNPGFPRVGGACTRGAFPLFRPAAIGDNGGKAVGRFGTASAAPGRAGFRARDMDPATRKAWILDRLLPWVQTPGQYIGGEVGAVVKDSRAVRGRVCLAFPDTYAMGMSHHGLQVLYAVMNRRAAWQCERAFTPLPDFEERLRAAGLPLYGLETFTPLAEFDVVGFTLQYDLAATNILTMLDLGGIPLAAAERATHHPLVLGGGPGAASPEPLARFFDAFILGDGEEALPAVCDEWLALKRAGADRVESLRAMARRFPFLYVPRFYAPAPPESSAPRGATLPLTGAAPQVGEPRVPRPADWSWPAAVRPIEHGLPERIEPAVIENLDAVPLPTAPVVPWVETVQDRIAIEIMRGCPGRCRFCQSRSLKHPLRYRRVETIVAAAVESYRNTGYDEVSLLSLSTSDYPEFDALLARLREVLGPLGVAVSVPSLRINQQLHAMGERITTERHSGLTVAPEAARPALRERIGKPLCDEDLFEGCRRAFAAGFHRVKMYFMVGLPGETRDDLDGIIELADAVARIGREVRGRWPTVVLNVSNFVPKPHTPLQWSPMQRREYLRGAGDYLRRTLTAKRFRNIELKHHDVEASLLEGVLCRGDRRVGEAIERAWRRGARLDAWREHFRPDLWWQALAECGIDVERVLHAPLDPGEPLPWDHIATRQGRDFLCRQWRRAAEAPAGAETTSSPPPRDVPGEPSARA